LDTAVQLASDWLTPDKLVVREAHSEKDVISYNSDGTNRLGNIKTVVLINGGSASAAEILSGTLKDNGKAILIGEKSFGKGSVQELVPLSSDTAVKVTIAKWITPSGKNLNKDGLNPDIEVKLTDDDIKNQRDPQLDRALQEASK
jgi:carboxyl-terminal processing protease